jgi:hypothetical protein
MKTNYSSLLLSLSNYFLADFLLMLYQIQMLCVECSEFQIFRSANKS